MQQIKDVLTSVLAELQTPEKLTINKLVSQWAKITGPKIAPHTKPYLNKEGVLCVWVDDSVLAYELNQKYRDSLLKRTQAALGEGTVKSIRIRVGQLR